jgi:hypothetical protein
LKVSLHGQKALELAAKVLQYGHAGRYFPEDYPFHPLLNQYVDKITSFLLSYVHNMSV